MATEAMAPVASTASRQVANTGTPAASVDIRARGGAADDVGAVGAHQCGVRAAHAAGDALDDDGRGAGEGGKAPSPYPLPQGEGE